MIPANNNDLTDNINSIYLFIFRSNYLLLKCLDDKYEVPMSDSASQMYNGFNLICVPTFIDGHECGAITVAPDYQPGENMCFVSLRDSYHCLPEKLYRVAGIAYQLLYWEENSKYCSVCGSLMERLPVNGKCCPNCKKEVWPRINPAIIVLIRRKELGEAEKVLLVKAHNFKGDFYGLVAGFLEVGESLEECVVREVYEETHLKIKNLKYFGSQSWPYPSGIMIGFIADYDGGEIVLQESELKSASWYSKDTLPRIPEKLSIARKLIDYWVDSMSTSS